MSRSKLIGLACVVVAVLVAGGALLWQRSRPAPVEPTGITGYLGGEKISLFEDDQFSELAQKVGLDISYKKAGSLAMMDADRTGMDYLFPSSQAAVAYGQAQGVRAQSSDIVLNSPIVVYTYKDVADALVGSGIMSKDGDVYKLDAVAAVNAMVDNKTWADLGYANGYGQFRIDSTDPAQSNSGNEWAALVATALNGGQPATAESVARDADMIRAVFQKSGWMETSSEDSFSQFLTLGEGSKPMMVGYESQVLDLSVNQPDLFRQVKDQLVVAYTTPTEWSTHVLVSLDDNGDKLRDFLKSDDVQRLAWERHGFRGASQLGTDSASRFGVPGIAERVPAAVELPGNDAMQALIAAVK
ncbi:substrate-binding domain-containing protein [Olsenella uli]|uniref:substrate-binding domain-containing protein n=1 Tax=Olsenella uli TaxID=133926 RepID=UPI0016511CB2|nr:substrate-binding domain-containing protein [Olsenella uli]